MRDIEPRDCFGQWLSMPAMVRAIFHDEQPSMVPEQQVLLSLKSSRSLVGVL